MKNTLCIDCGNTLVKAAIFDEQDQVLAHEECAPSGVETMCSSLRERFAPVATALSAVAGDINAFRAQLEAQGPLLHVTSTTRVPVVNAYHSPATLGADRLAVAVAIEHQHPGKNNLVISAGTCITYNFVAANRTFRGGAISPGMRMRLQAMHAFTQLLPETDAAGELLLLGYDTETCMRAGALLGAAAEIHGMIQAYSSQYPDLNPVLTGGDAPFLARQLKSKIFADPYLALRGLNLILKYNDPTLR